MQLNISPLSTEHFLKDYWQQQPLLIKGGLRNFANPLEADELAGLATEANIESRLIYRQQQCWNAVSGPFADYRDYGNKDWTLVVQAVNHWVPAAQKLALLFNFIPQWRFDDVMVSYAVPGGGVGPHVDNYDVFICQGSGQRRWRVGDRAPVKEVIAHEKLLHVENFTAIIDEVVSAGDVLYIPPGFPHEGISLDTSMSFSVGYKSTNATELLSGFADYLIDFDDAPALLSDSHRRQSHYGQIDATDFDRIRSFLQHSMDNEEKLADFIGIHYSQSLSELDIAQEEYDFSAWLSTFTAKPLQKLYALKTLYLEKNIDQGIFYVDGERHRIDGSPELIRKLCNNSEISIEDINQHEDSDNILQWLWQSSRRGYWYF